MQKRVIVASAVIVSILAVAQPCTAVDIPFEFFYGRWALGHQPTGHLELQEGEKPDRELDYRYSSDKWQVRLSQIRGKILYYDEDDHLQWPVPSFYLRPAGNWQIGLDSLRIEETVFGSKLEPSEAAILSRRNRDIDFGISAGWLSSRSVRIADRHFAYSYFHRPLVGRGNLRVDASIWFREEMGFWSSQLRTSDAFMRSRQEVRRWWSGTAFIDWGLSDFVEVSATFIDRFSYWKVLQDRAGSQPDGDWYQRHDRSYRSDEEPRYNLAATVVGLAPVYFVAGFGQRFRQRDTRSNVATLEAGDSTNVSESWYSTDMAEQTSHLRLSGRYLSFVSFRPEVLLDDYSGYYHHMLFHRQTDLSVDFDYQRYGPPGDFTITDASLEVIGQIGLFDYLQVGVDGRYRRRKVPIGGQYYLVSASAGVTVAVRSYRYRPGQGPGWDRDCAEDIAFGPVPPCGHLYFMIDYRSPSYSRESSDRIGFLSLKDLRSDHWKLVRMSLTAGLGRGFMITAEDEQQVYYSTLFSRAFSGSLSARIKTHWRTIVRYTQEYFNGETQDPTIRLELSALL